ncbi:MAG: L,D-transpeptidase [Verrucomicrobiota bacterium]
MLWNAGLAGLLAVALPSCASSPSGAPKKGPGGSLAAQYNSYDTTAYRPKNPSNVRVKVSLQNQMVYVMEGSQPLLVTPTCAGTASNPTPKGNFRLGSKVKNRRSNSYGFFINSATNQVVPAKRSKRPSGSGWTYKGAPLGYWCPLSSKPAYGFHSGWVHPMPKSHGCLRLHKNIAPKFFDIVRAGTRVNIANTQPEDATIGRNIPRPPSPASLPDDPPSVSLTDLAFANNGSPLKDY